MNNRDDVDMCFLDFGKTFDIVNHRIICLKLATFGVSPHVVGLVQNFLANPLFQVVTNDVISEEQPSLVTFPKALQFTYYYF